MSNNPEDKIVAQHEDVKKISSEANKGVWSRFGKVKPEFFKHLADNYQNELKAAGMTPEQINKMHAGKTPNLGNENDPWMVHHTTPRTVSGNLKNPNDFSNLVLIRKSSEQVLHHFIDPQYAGLKPGESTNIVMVRPAGEFCGLKEAEVDKQVKKAILNPEQNNAHAPENQGFGPHTHGAKGQKAKHLEHGGEEESVATETGGGSEGESDSPKRGKKHRRNKKHHEKYGAREEESNSYKGGKHFSMDDSHDRHHSHGMKGY